MQANVVEEVRGLGEAIRTSGGLVAMPLLEQARAILEHLRGNPERDGDRSELVEALGGLRAALARASARENWLISLESAWAAELFEALGAEWPASYGAQAGRLCAVEGRRLAVEA